MQVKDTARFSLAELVEATGLSERTIRHYISEGLVAPALGRGRARYYTPEHLRQLALVSDLRDKRLSIEEIRQRVATPPAPQAPPTDRWERMVVHPDLEIHLRADAPEHVRALARQLEAAAREWFGEE